MWMRIFTHGTFTMQRLATAQPSLALRRSCFPFMARRYCLQAPARCRLVTAVTQPTCSQCFYCLSYFVFYLCASLRFPVLCLVSSLPSSSSLECLCAHAWERSNGKKHACFSFSFFSSVFFSFSSAVAVAVARFRLGADAAGACGPALLRGPAAGCRSRGGPCRESHW